MSTDLRVERLIQGMTAFNSGDLDGVTHVLNPNVTWHVSGDSRFAGDYKGREKVVAMLKGLKEAAGSGVEVHPEGILVGERFLMSFTRFKGGLPDGSEVDVLFADASTWDDEGRVVEWWWLPNDQEAYDRWLSS